MTTNHPVPNFQGFAASAVKQNIEGKSTAVAPRPRALFGVQASNIMPAKLSCWHEHMCPLLYRH